MNLAGSTGAVLPRLGRLVAALFGNASSVRSSSRRPQRQLAPGRWCRVHLGGFEALPQILIFGAEGPHFAIQ
jgi:hypothetical protein